MADAWIPLQIVTTVCAATVDELPAIRDLVDDFDAGLWSVFVLVPVGRVAPWIRSIPTVRKRSLKGWSRLVPTHRSVSKRQRRHTTVAFRPFGSGSRAIPAKRPRTASGGGRGITAEDGFAFVSHTGDGYPSSFLPRAAGNARSESIVDIYRTSELFRSLRDRDALRGKCGASEYRYLCGGSRSRAFAYTGDPLVSDPLCAYVPDGYNGPLPAQSLG